MLNLQLASMTIMPSSLFPENRSRSFFTSCQLQKDADVYPSGPAAAVTSILERAAAAAAKQEQRQQPGAESEVDNGAAVWLAVSLAVWLHSSAYPFIRLFMLRRCSADVTWLEIERVQSERGTILQAHPGRQAGRHSRPLSEGKN